MGGTGTRVSKALLIAVSCLLLTLQAVAEESGRWRYGSISWRKATSTGNKTNVIFTVESAWRLSHGSLVVFGTEDKVSAPGEQFKVLASDGQDPLFATSNGDVTARFDVTVLRVEPAQDLVVGRSEFAVEFDTLGVYTANLTLCCKVGGHQNGNNGVKLMSRVDLINDDQSPRITMMPKVTVDAAGAAMTTFLVPAVSDTYAARTDLRWTVFNEFWTDLFSTAPNSTIFTGIDMMTGVANFDVSCYMSGSCDRDLNLMVEVSQATGGGSTAMVDFVVAVQTGSGATPVLTLKAPDSPHPLAGQTATTVMGMPVLQAFEGYEIAFSVRGSDSDTLDSVFYIYNTLPDGAVTEAIFETNPSSQTLKWTPSSSQVGQHYVCAQAVDGDPNTACGSCTPLQGEGSCDPPCPSHRRTAPLCFNVNVQANNAPSFTPISSARPCATTADGGTLCTIEMNYLFQATVQAVDANWDDAVTLMPSGTHPTGSQLVPVPGQTSTVVFTWRPGSSFGGWEQDVCFEAIDSPVAGRAVQSTTLCLRVRVEKCVWNVGSGQSLATIAQIFGTNYVQMWALNPTLVSPDGLLGEGDLVNVGHLYSVRSTDNYRYLSVQFQTTRATLEWLNYGFISSSVGDKDALTSVAGQEMCILPHSCVGYVPGAE